MTPFRETGRIGQRGTFVIPAQLRQRFGLQDGSEIVVEETTEGILLRPAATLPVEIYTPERRAELLLSNAVGEDDYMRVREVVRGMGVDPDAVPHERP